MKSSLNITSKPVQSVFSEYRNKKYIVNRKYQRKLVWTVDEKQKFIDSLLNSYPIPLFLCLEIETIDGMSYEILDGMQRLNAITSFIEGEYPVNGCYFDLSAVGDTNILLKRGEIHQKDPVMDLDDCTKIMNYPLPISTFRSEDQVLVNETFQRINTGGRQLSKQDVRQAGVLAPFPELVRKASIHIRGDVSHSDILTLNDMTSISISNRDLNYGIRLQNIFWVKHRIITNSNIRQSRDEELVAHILAFMIDKNLAETTSDFLDRLYNENSDTSMRFTRGINKLGAEFVELQFKYVYNELRKTLDSNNSIFSELVFKDVNGVGNIWKVNNVFQIIFLSFYELLVDKNLKIRSYQNLCLSLRNIANLHLVSIRTGSGKKWNKTDRARHIKSIAGVIEQYFTPKGSGDPSLDSWVDNLENLLRQSRTEQVCYDFKLGFYSLDKNRPSFNRDLVKKVVKTLTAMANTRPGTSYVIVGVADKKVDADKFRNFYSKDYKNFSEGSVKHYITGVDTEAEKFHEGLDAYERKIQQTIDNAPVIEEVRNKILMGMNSFQYYDKTILLFKITRGEEPYYYDGKYYIRKMSNVSELAPTELYRFMDDFRKQNQPR